MRFGTLTEQIYHALRHSILSGELTPGERMKELDLAKRFATSQTPVREALARLSQDGLVQIDRYRGATVSAYTARDFRNLYHIRLLLELPTIRVAALHASPDQIAQLHGLLERGDSALREADATRFEQVDLDFHETLSAAADNPYLTRLIRSNHEKVQSIRQVVSVQHIGERSQAEHAAMVRAIEAQDAEEAEALLRHHIDRTQTEVLAEFPR